APPFRWVDGAALFSPAVQAHFSPADVRTEYIPILPLNAPDKSWPDQFAAPLLDPEALSDLWEPRAVEAALEPLAAGYEKWIPAQEAAAASLSGRELEAARANLSGCRAVLPRIRA